MKITLGEEQVVAIGPRYEDSYWGQFQFVQMLKGENGKVALTFHNGDDVWEELGSADIWYTTDNRGETWEKLDDPKKVKKGLRLPNGDYLRHSGRTSKALDLDKVQAPVWTGNYTIPSDDLHAKSNDVNKLPLPAGHKHDIWKQKHCVYHVDRLPDGLYDHLHAWPQLRTKAGAEEETLEWAELKNWGNMGLQMVFPTTRNVAIPLMPQFLGRSYQQGPDGKLWAATYWAGMNPKNGAYSPYCSVYVLNSEDDGHSWTLQGHVPYIPDNDEYENAFMVGGFSETALIFNQDGSMSMILRITDVLMGDKEWAPSYITRSTDQGKTWSKPVRFDDVGVLPGVCQMGDVTLAIYGRPGIYVRGTTDPAGMKWEEPVEVMTNEDRSNLMNERPERVNFHMWAGSCCNCAIVALDDTHAMIGYSDFYHLCEDGVRRKSIKTRIVTVEKD